MEYPIVPNGKNVKKKKVMDELDRLKHAEKKKRRLEKAIATSAAIRSELEKKKQKRIEEQQRLDKEGAAIAEAVALNVLLEEDSDDDSCNIMLRKNNGFKHWDRSSNLNLFMERAEFSPRSLARSSMQGIGLVSNAYGSEWNWPVSSEPIGRHFYGPYFEQGGPEISAGQLAARAVSSLRIEEDTIVFNGVFRR